MRTKKAYILLVIVLLINIVIRFKFIFSDLDQIIRIVPDDIFYYLKTAQNISQGLGSTFDGINITNGYHPLWMLLLIPITSIFRDPMTIIRTCLFLCVILDLASGIPVFFILLKFTGNEWISVFLVAVFWTNYKNITFSLNGLETSLVLFVFSAIVYWLFIIKNFSLRNKWDYIHFGLLEGILFLSRTDNVFYIFGISLVVILCNSVDIKKCIQNGVFNICGFFLITIPWIIWNLISFGSIIQTSGIAIPLVEHELQSINPMNFGAFFKALFDNLSVMIGFSKFYWLVVASCSIFIVSTWKKIKLEMKEYLSMIIFSWIGGIILFYVHSMVRLYIRDYYFPLMIVIFILLLGYLLTRIQLPKEAIIYSLFTISLTITLGIYSVIELSKGIYIHQTQMVEAAYWLRDHTDKKEIIGSFNSGIIGFFSQRKVVNLDGVINNSVVDAIKNRNLIMYMKEENIQYFLDYSHLIPERYKPFMGNMDAISMKLIYKIDQPGINCGGNPYEIYRLSFH